MRGGTGVGNEGEEDGGERGGMMEAGMKREVDCEHLVFEADCVGWLLRDRITLILPLLFVRELREKRGGGALKNQHANNTTLLT